MADKPTYEQLQQRVWEYEQEQARWRRALAALQESEKRGRQIIEASNAGYFFIDLEGRFRQVNAAWLRMHKYDSPQEVLGRHFSLTQVSEEASQASDVIDRLRAGGEVASGEFSRLCKDGSVGYHDFTVKTVQEDGEIIGFEGFILDTTDRKRAERALRQSEEKYRSLFQNMLDGFALHQIVRDEAGRPVDYVFLEVNAAFERLTGMRRRDILGRKVTQVLPGIEHDPADWIGRYGEVAMSGVEDRFVHYSESLGKWFSVLAYRPEMGRFATIFEDVTERKRAEQALAQKIAQLNLILNNAPVVLSAVDRRGVFILCEGKGLEALGSEQGQLVGTSAFDLYRQTHPEILEYAERALNGEEVVVVVELAGETFDAHFTPIREPDGEISGVVVVSLIITERKRAEATLRASEERYRTLFENSMDAALLTAPDGRILSANKAACEMFRCSEEEICRMGREGVTDPNDPRVAEALAERARTGRFKSEMTMRRADGTTFLGDVASTMFQDQRGRPRTSIIIRDVTEQRRAEQALRESEEIFRAAFMGNPLGVVISRRDDGVWVDVNQPALDMSGYSREEVAGKSALEMKFWADPGERDKIIKEIESGVEVNNREVLLRRKDGSLFTASLSVRPLTLKGTEHLLFLTEDVTQRRKAEAERLRLQKQLADAVDLAQLGHWEYDVLRDEFTFNDQFYKIFGTTAAEVGGYVMSSAQYAERFVHPQDRGVVAREIKDAIETSDPDYRGQLEHRMLYADGRTGHVSVLFFIIKDAGGRTIGTYGVNQDITERKLIQERLQKAEKMDALGTLASGIAHDFNNILAAILGYSELAIDDLPPGHPAEHNISEITKAADRAKNLVRQILTFSRKAETDQRPISLNRAVRDAAGLLERTIPKMINLELALDQDIRPIKADPGQMEQLLVNLAGNAADAMESGGSITITTRNVTLDREECEICGDILSGEYVLLSVRDTGAGMTPEVKARIFDPFFTTKGVGKGTGLGLSTVYGIVTGHGGHIMCRSRPGRGTEFRVFLPVAQDLGMAEPTGQAPPAPPPGGDETILLVDDEASVRDIAGRMLSRAGYAVLKAASGEEALEMFQEHSGRIQAVVLDLGMPGMGGKACLSAMRRLDPSSKVLIASGYIQYELSDELQNLGAAGMVAKPYRKAELLRRLREMLDEPPDQAASAPQ